MNKLLPEHIDFESNFPNLTRRLRLGVVGGGRVAATQVAAAKLSDYWEVTAGALSSDPETARQRGTEWRIPNDRCYSTFEDMARIESSRPDGVDAVMITTPNHMHYPCAKVFIEAGIGVLCDKPLTNDLQEAKQLQQYQQQAKTPFGVSYVMSCFPMMRQARILVANGAIGEINQIHVEFMQDWMTPPEVAQASHVQWRLDPTKSGLTSCVGDIGTHAAHLASFVSGLPLTHIKAERHVCGAPKPLEDTLFAFTRYADKIPGTLLATRLAPGNRGGLRLRIYGSEGGIEWDLERPESLRYCPFDQPDQTFTRGHGHGIFPQVERHVRLARGFSEGMIEAWANLYTEFAMAVAAHKDELSYPKDWLAMPTIHDGVHGVGFIHSVVDSDEQGQWVAMNL